MRSGHHGPQTIDSQQGAEAAEGPGEKGGQKKAKLTDEYRPATEATVEAVDRAAHMALRPHLSGQHGAFGREGPAGTLQHGRGPWLESAAWRGASSSSTDAWLEDDAWRGAISASGGWQHSWQQAWQQERQEEYDENSGRGDAEKWERHEAMQSHHVQRYNDLHQKHQEADRLARHHEGRASQLESRIQEMESREAQHLRQSHEHEQLAATRGDVGALQAAQREELETLRQEKVDLEAKANEYIQQIAQLLTETRIPARPSAVGALCGSGPAAEGQLVESHLGEALLDGGAAEDGGNGGAADDGGGADVGGGGHQVPREEQEGAGGEKCRVKNKKRRKKRRRGESPGGATRGEESPGDVAFERRLRRSRCCDPQSDSHDACRGAELRGHDVEQEVPENREDQEATRASRP